MPPKPTSNKWSDMQLAIAAIAMTSVLALWNMFAGPDREKTAQKMAEQTTPTPTIEAAPAPVVAATMPPMGYTILFGGQAPKQQVVTMQSGGGRGGGGGGGGSSAPVTTTKSS